VPAVEGFKAITARGVQGRSTAARAVGSRRLLEEAGIASARSRTA
jgi:hypothetical protein